MRHWPLLLLPALTLAASAQSTSAKPGTGAVSGHVYCADTNAPARMASVQLKPIKETAPRPGTDAHDLGMPASGVVQTTLDGSFTIPNVAPGSYYVLVTASGYLSPHPQDQEIDDAKAQPHAPSPPISMPKVDVQADQAANIDIRLERGAAVSGNIRFDDGSPATNVMVMLMRKSKGKWEPLPTGDFGAFAMPNSLMTDDLGHYRTGGLRQGEYLVMVTLLHADLLPAHGSGLSGALRSILFVYSGDTMRKSEAVPVKLGPGEDRAGVDINIPLSKLHSISGVVTAARDGHVINSGHLTIEDPVDKESIVEAELDGDGAFHLDGVPEGSYTLRILDPSDKQNQRVSVAGDMKIDSEKILHQYGNLEQPLKVEGDMPNLVLAVPEQKKQQASQ